MKITAQTKPALWGGVIGAVAVAIAGFTWGGWVTGGTAESMATAEAKAAVVAALAPICLAQAKSDPQSPATMAKLKETSNYQRGSIVMEAGWATMPGSTEPNRAVADACLVALAPEL
jgi:hypothetical protein